MAAARVPAARRAFATFSTRSVSAIGPPYGRVENATKSVNLTPSTGIQVPLFGCPRGGSWLKKSFATFSRTNSHLNIGHVDHGKTTLTAAITRRQSAAGASSIRFVAGARAAPWAPASRKASTVREAGRDADGGLISVLRAELDHERKTYSQNKELARGPPKPWTLTDKKGRADVILRRSYGQEDIAVTCVYQPDAYGDEGRDEQPGDSEEDMDQEGMGSSVNMTITVNKGGLNPTLEISAASYGNEITIDHVYFWDDNESKDAMYDGPNFLQLDEEVQNQFERFIKTRGVNKELTGYLFTLLDDKEQREYMGWLQKVEGFLKL